MRTREKNSAVFKRVAHCSHGPVGRLDEITNSNRPQAGGYSLNESVIAGEV
jgi:hypothetical protein